MPARRTGSDVLGPMGDLVLKMAAKRQARALKDSSNKAQKSNSKARKDKRSAADDGEGEEEEEPKRLRGGAGRGGPG